MKATEQYFPVVLCIILYKVVLTLEFGLKRCIYTIHHAENYRVVPL